MKSLVVTIGLIFFSFYYLVAQKEYNVKLRSDQPILQTYFQANKGKFLSWEDRQNQRNQHPLISKIQYIQPLSPSINDCYTLRIDAGISFSEFTQSHAFVYVEENKTRKLDALNSQPNDDSLAAQWHHNKIKTFDAWDITKGKSEIIVGVIDTGLDYEHPDFQGQLAINTAEDHNQNGTFEPWQSTETRNGKTGDLDGIDQDGNGYADDVIGYDFTDTPRSPAAGDYLFPDADPLDEQSHGTFVSGIISAKENNQIGGAGIAPACKLKVLKAFGAEGTGEDDDIARAIVYAADNGVRVLNLSFGDAYASQMMHEAIQYAYKKGVVIIASAGNGTGDDLHYPSNFDEVISVSATTLDGENEYLWQLSSYGWAVALTAPGAGIFSTTLRDSIDGKWVEYARASGTSASAPMVASGACLLLSQRPTLTPEQIRGILCNGADDLMNEGWDFYTGAGRLNLLQSLKTIGGSNVRILSPQNDGGSSRDTVYVTGTALDPEFQSFSLQYYKGTESSNNPNWQTIVTQTQQIANDTLAIWNLAALPQGDYVLRLVVNKSDGFTIEDRIRFLRDKTPPEIKVEIAAPAWDNATRKFYLAFRSNDVGIHTIAFRKMGETNFRYQTTDKKTKNGEFLLDLSTDDAGIYEYFIQTQNAANLSYTSPLQTFEHLPQQIEQSGFKVLDEMLPMGAFLPQSFDFDQDGNKEIVMSQYNSRLSFGKIKFYEHQTEGFQLIDSITIKNILIPKSAADADNDGRLDLLASVNDSTYIFSQNSNNSMPTTVSWSRLGGDLYAARLADTDNDNTPELLLKDFKDYQILKRNGNEYQLAATLPDISGNYQGSIAPRTLVADFDADGNTEILYGDYDGDFLIYEFAGNNTYTLRYADTLNPRQKAGEYIINGDFDGDGKQEIFVATHALPGLRNADKEYDPNYLHLRIFKATSNNIYQQVWQDILYDLDTDAYNAATVGNIDNDPEDEIVLTTFPRTYTLEYQNNQYQFTWFHYGDICTHHVIGDFDQNGIQEIGIGRGDSTLFYEKITNVDLPQAVTTLSGIVLDEHTTQLSWQPSPNATSYVLLRQVNVPNPPPLTQFLETTATSFIDTTVSPNQSYLYTLVSIKNGNNSDFGNVIQLRPHARIGIDSLVALSATQLKVFFSYQVEDIDENKTKFLLNATESPITLISTQGNALILSFQNDFQMGANIFRIDTSFLDAERGRLRLSDTTQTFVYQPNISTTAYLTHWERLNDKQALLHFNLPMTDQVLDLNRYTVSPTSQLSSIEWEDNDQRTIKISFQDVILGGVGYSVSVTVQNVKAQDGSPIQEGEGNTATFTENASDLSEVYTYPSPLNISKSNTTPLLHFAKLPKIASINITTLSGRFVRTLEETDGDGGMEYDLKDLTGKPLQAGVYLYQVTDKNGKTFIGKFSLIQE